VGRRPARFFEPHRGRNVDDIVQPTGLVAGDPENVPGTDPAAQGEGTGGEGGPKRKPKAEPMVRVRQLVHMTGTHADYPMDLERETTKREADGLIRAGFAELVEDDGDGEDDKPKAKRGKRK
jgi:hypothetical protein